MASKLISKTDLITAIRDDAHIRGVSFARVKKHIEDAPTVDDVEVVYIEQAKQEILQRMDNFIGSYKGISQSPDDFWGGKAETMDVARRLVNTALTYLCTNFVAKMDGDGNG